MPKLWPIIYIFSPSIIPLFICNSRQCIDCCLKADQNYNEMCKNTINIDRLMPFLRKYIRTIRLQSISLIGGEITEYYHCCKLISMLTREFPGIRLLIVTNGQNHRCINEIISGAKYRQNLEFKFSIDGYGDVCDSLRGKKSYFPEVLLSIEEVFKRGLSSVRINIRCYPKFQPYDSKTLASFSTPGILPDGHTYTCYNFLCVGLRVGNISDNDVVDIITKRLNLARLNPKQCNRYPCGIHRTSLFSLITGL